MKGFGGLFQTADWKTEKRVPVIECPDRVKDGDMFLRKVYDGRSDYPNILPHPQAGQEDKG
jgi:superoxide reductase